MKTIPYILLILNCKKYNFKRVRQKADWLECSLPNNFLYFHIHGDPSLNTTYLIDFSNNLITVKCDDRYLFLPKKMILAYKCIHETFDYKYIFKTDDDFKLVQHDFFYILTDYLKKNNIDYGGELRYEKGHMSSYHQLSNNDNKNLILLEKTKYCGGTFYFIKNNIIKILLSRYFQDICNRILEDHAFGYYISKITKNIRAIKGDIANIFQVYYKENLLKGFYYNKKVTHIFKPELNLKYIGNGIINPYLYALNNNNDLSNNLCIFNDHLLNKLNNTSRRIYQKLFCTIAKIQNNNNWDIICIISQNQSKNYKISKHPPLSAISLYKGQNNTIMPFNLIIKSERIPLMKVIFKSYFNNIRGCLYKNIWRLLEYKLNIYYTVPI